MVMLLKRCTLSIANFFAQLSVFVAAEDCSPEEEQALLAWLPFMQRHALRLSDRFPNETTAEHLCNCGILALLDGIKRYQPTLAISRDKFLTLFIVASMNRECARFRRPVAEAACHHLWQASTQAFLSHQRLATNEQLIDRLGVTAREFATLLDQAAGLGLFDPPDQFEGNLDALLEALFGEVMRQHAEPSPNEQPGEILAGLIQCVAESISELPTEERTVLSLYYHENVRFSGIAEILSQPLLLIQRLHTLAIVRIAGKITARFGA